MVTLQHSTHFRPCIDLHNGLVKQIVGGTLRTNDHQPKTNFTSNLPASHYAAVYQKSELPGGHIIMLGPNNQEAARMALEAWPNGLQIGGGINIDNALDWLTWGASKVIITSWLFPDGLFDLNRLQRLSSHIGKDQLVIDLSCKHQLSSSPTRKEIGWVIAMDKWTRLTNLNIDEDTLTTQYFLMMVCFHPQRTFHLQRSLFLTHSLIVDPGTLCVLGEYCSEFLVHAADVEGLCQGIDQELVEALGQWSPIPCTYAGGGRSADDLALVHKLSQGRVDLTIGSALDIFCGSGVTLAECIAWNKAHPR